MILPPRRLVLVVSALVLVLGACGGGGGKAEVTTSTAPATAPPTSAPPQVVVEPPSGPVNTTFNLKVAGLKPADQIVFKIEGPKNYTFQGQAHAVGNDGTVSAEYHATAKNAPGDYTVRALDNGQEVATGTFSITAGAAPKTTAKATSTTKAGATSTTRASTTTKP